MRKYIFTGLAVFTLGVLVAAFGSVFAESQHTKLQPVSEHRTYQNTVRHNIQPTVSDAFLQWGDSPQDTASVETLYTAESIN